jgi:hypothetical protein
MPFRQESPPQPIDCVGWLGITNLRPGCAEDGDHRADHENSWPKPRPGVPPRRRAKAAHTPSHSMLILEL